MDCSWFVEDDDNEDPGSESDPEERQAELETRLYSIVHHSDLSQPLPPELAKHYSVQCGDDGKLTVELNDSLENIKSEEVKKVDHLVSGFEHDAEVSEVVENECLIEKDDAILISDGPFNSEKHWHKRFRYSDVNLDLSDVPMKVNGVNEPSSSDINYSDLNYFKITQSFLKKKKIKKLKDLVIPDSFQTGESLDWKNMANESFISVGSDTSGSEKDIIDQMVCALKEANPKSSKGNLYYLARALFFHNRKKHRKLKRRKQNKIRVIKETLQSPLEVTSEIFNATSIESFTENSESIQDQSANFFDGSVSLNISPFKPLPPVVDLVSEDEVDHLNATAQKTTTEDEVNHLNTTAQKTTKKWKSLPKCEIPTKWTKKMTKFYTKPIGRKLEMELNDIFEELKRNSTDDDWRVDPRDEMGVYQRTPVKGKHRNRRCPNCHQHGHLMHECPSPRKIPSCFLCGLNFHTAYSCPNKICLKCGVHVAKEAYECTSCYYNTFNYDTPCGICGQVTHRTEICPDLWRSFHATVEGDKKIPECVKENKRKYCCNCAAKGHFSHQCPFPSCEGEQMSSFVTNYAALESGTTEIVIPSNLSNIIESPTSDRFLQELSDSTKAVIDVEQRQANVVFRVNGTFDQCRKVKNEIEEFMNTRKRKRHEPYPKKKRRKMF